MIVPKPEQGFTLIEVLLAMSLMSIMMVLLFASLKMSAQSWEKGEKKIDEVNDIAAVVNFFQRHLTVTKPLWNDFTKEERTFSFQGNKERVQFVSAFPASAGRAGLQLISVALVREGREQALKVSITPFFPSGEGDDWLKEEETLIKHVQRFSLSYFGPEEGRSHGRWQDEWLEKESQPKLVKIKIDLENGIFWPEMIFDLKIAGSLDDSGLAIGNDSEEDDEADSETDNEGDGGQGFGFNEDDSEE